MNSTSEPRANRVSGDIDRDPEWSGLLAEAAAAAGLSGPDVQPELRVLDPDPGRSPITGSDGRAGQGDPAAFERHLPLGVTGVACRTRDRAASVGGELLATSSLRAVSGSVDVPTQELRMTCQVGRFSVHREARTSFAAEHSGELDRWNRSEAGLEAVVPGEALAGARSGQVVANVLVPVAYQNTLQRIWRLAVPSPDMLKRPDGRHLAVAGVRGTLELRVEHGDATAVARTDFVRRALSAHQPDDVRGFGPRSGTHVLEADVAELDPLGALRVHVSVVLRAALAGDPRAYRDEAAFYAGLDFGGGGSVRMPQRCLSEFDIPLTPLIGNGPITLLHLGFLAHD